MKVCGYNLTIEDVYEVAHNNKQIELDNCVIPTIKASRNFLENYIKTGKPVYGVTTNFGDQCDNQINYKKAGELQRDICHFHGIGLGPVFSKEISRAVMLCRLNSNVKDGHSAIRLDLANMMVDMLNKDIVPVIPMLGSVGASGDLTPLSYLAAAIMGERQVYYHNKIVPTSIAFKKEGIKPLLLEAKEGLALMNGTSVMTAVAALALNDIKRLANISDYLTAVTTEIVRGKETPFLKETNQYKNHKGQIESASYVFDIIKNSQRVYQYEDFLNKEIVNIEDKGFVKQKNKIQDRYSVRCAPQVNGVLRDTISLAERWINEEINSANDNPLIDLEKQRIYNTGNFYGGHICGACDYLKIALANISDLSDKQAEIIIDSKFNGLTENLIPYTAGDHPRAGLRLGFKAAQITISAIRGEVLSYTFPISITSAPTEALNQDKVSMGTISARKLTEQVDLIYLQFATHILAAMQAVDLAGYDNFSFFTKEIYKEIRKISKFVEDDRPLDKEATEVAQWLRSTKLFKKD